MIPANELAQIQADVAAIALDKTCVIQRKTTSIDLYGSQSVTWATIATVKAGMTAPSAAELEMHADLIGSMTTWQVHLPVGTNVQRQDHLLIDNDTLIVQALHQPRSYECLLSLLASEVKS